MPIVTQLYRYAVKSCAGESLPVTTIAPSGLPFDRAFMVADAQGNMVTGRTDPALVLIQPHLCDSVLTLNAPGCDALQVRLDRLAQPLEARVHRQQFTAYAGAQPADDWLSAYLGKPVRLLYQGDQPTRRVRVAPDIPLGFADGYPLLLIGQASLDDLNRRVGRELAMQRFRPNLVVSGWAAFAEDSWRRIRIGDVILRIEKPCERCVLTTVDPLTGEKSADQEPLRTLATYRKTEAGVLFGQNVIAENVGEIAVGMEVEILDRV